MRLNGIITIAMTLFVLASGCSYQVIAGNAQEKQASPIAKAKTNYLQALKMTENPPVVESAIFHVVKLKRFYPAENMAEIEKELGRLSHDGETKAIRFKAYIAQMYLSNADLMAEIQQQDYKDGDRFFAMLNLKLQDTLFNMTVEK